jgi:hypothetical protein
MVKINNSLRGNMSTLDPKPVKTKSFPNPKLLPIAALLLIVLALLFMATPLLRSTRGFQGGGNFANRGNGQTVPPNGFVFRGNGSQGQVSPGQDGGPQIQVSPGLGGRNLTGRRFAVGGGLLGGFIGPVIYFIALLVSLAAAIGMFMTKRWGQVLGIIMGVLYFLLGLLSLLPIIFTSFLGLRNPLSLILGIVHVLLAVAVIVLASIPAKKVTAVVVPVTPPAAST